MKKHSPTAEQRVLVRELKGLGMPQVQIARKIGVDEDTMCKHYRDELDEGLACANAQIAGALFQKALGGDTACMIFWLKTRGGWKEKTSVEVSGEVRTMKGTFLISKPGDEPFEIEE